GVRLPVYLLFTKTDLVAGFTDFFADFSQEEREQVWGETFPVDDPAHPRDWLKQFDSAFDELLQRLNKRSFKRIQEERDVQRRSLILDYPQQMALLKPSLFAFLQGAFAPNRYEQAPLLRGVYFTSATQEGTPIDRIMGLLAGAFRLDRQALPMFSGRGKSFFLTRLLKEVIFPEAELAGADPRIERRQRWLQFGALGAASLLTLGIIGLWAISYGGNRSAIARTEQQIALYRAVDVVPTDSRSNFKMLGPKLDALLAITDLWRDSGWLTHFGLYQGDKFQAGADEAYQQLLREYFLPSLVARLQERMQGAEAASVLYQLLRVTLMFGQPEKLEPKIAAAVIRVDWEQTFATEPETLARLTTHLQNLLPLKLQPTRLDEGVIAAVRAKLTQVSQVQQCYDRFKSEAVMDHSHDFSLVEALKPNGQKAFIVADGRDIGVASIPGLFTAWGYGEWFLKKSLISVKECLEQNWVLGINTSAADPREIERLHQGFEALYLGEYQQYWSGLLSGLKLRPVSNLNQTVDLLDILSRPDSPLRLLLMAVEKNTSLSRISAAAADLLSQAAAKANLAPDEQTRKLFEAGKQAAGLDATDNPVRRLESYFESLNQLVRGGKDQPLPLDASLNKAKELRDYFMQTGGGEQAQKSAASRVEGGGSDVLAQAKLEFSRLPEPVKSWLLSLTARGLTQTLEGAKGELNEKLKTSGIAGGGSGGSTSRCKAAFAGRYPFSKASQQDAPLADFSKFFAPGGVLDQFFQVNLKDFVDTGLPQWRQKAADSQSLGLSQAAIGEFQLAAKIRDAFFFGTAQTPQVQFDLKPMDLDPNVDSFRLNIEGQEIVYRHGPEQVSRIQWPGPAAGSGVRIAFEMPDKRQLSRGKEGPWAWFRLLDESSLRQSGGADRFVVTFQMEGFTARYELRSASVNNPFNLTELQGFHCPESL
ncbi:MAG: type VI secretion system membrane subunit TssM, partial [Methylococcaceae bacterium]|nr:type VI secretion system membrane subunit TssM [Methylococcaceae bacterium]